MWSAKRKQWSRCPERSRLRTWIREEEGGGKRGTRGARERESLHSRGLSTCRLQPLSDPGVLGFIEGHMYPSEDFLFLFKPDWEGFIFWKQRVSERMLHILAITTRMMPSPLPPAVTVETTPPEYRSWEPALHGEQMQIPEAHHTSCSGVLGPVVPRVNIKRPVFLRGNVPGLKHLPNSVVLILPPLLFPIWHHWTWSLKDTFTIGS